MDRPAGATRISDRSGPASQPDAGGYNVEEAMPNSVLARIEFSFKGEEIEAVAVIDLDLCLRHGEPMHFIYHELAAQSGIGSHTYEYDVMVMEQAAFSNPTGIATDFTEDGRIDFDGLHAAWKQQKIDDTLRPIALRHLGIDNLDERPEVKAALTEAYLAN